MPYFEDLSEYVYGKENESNLVNIGWLDSKHPFKTGEVEPETALRVAKLCKNPVSRMRGRQRCWMCSEYPIREPFGGDGSVLTLGDAEIRISGRNKVYACPTLIYQYIVKHEYQPPEEFLEAVRFMEEISPHNL